MNVIEERKKLILKHLVIAIKEKTELVNKLYAPRTFSKDALTPEQEVLAGIEEAKLNGLIELQDWIEEN